MRIFDAGGSAFGGRSDLSRILAPPAPTHQPPRDIYRAAQHGKFYAYLLSYLPLAAGAALSRSAEFQLDTHPVAFSVHRISRLADTLGAVVQFQVSQGAEVFSSQPYYLTHIGDGQKPTVYLTPWFVRGNGKVTLIASDKQAGTLGLAGAPAAIANNIRLALFGLKLYADEMVSARRYTSGKDWTATATFWGAAPDNNYDTGPLATQGTAGSVRTYLVPTDTDSDLDVYSMSVISDGPCMVQVIVSSDQWFDTDLRSELLGGSGIETPVSPEAAGNFPCWLPEPYLVPGGVPIKVRVSNQTAVQNRVEVAFRTVRLYPKGGVQPQAFQVGDQSVMQDQIAMAGRR